ncbi:hypothetical protein ACFX2A_019348 [Malus domestica]
MRDHGKRKARVISSGLKLMSKVISLSKMLDLEIIVCMQLFPALLGITNMRLILQLNHEVKSIWLILPSGEARN